MTDYDDIIVGSGIGGMSAALMLAMNGRKVLMLEKKSEIGGCMKPFKRNNILFDVGFHFSIGLREPSFLEQLFRFLGIQDDILSGDSSSSKFVRIVNEAAGRVCELEIGRESFWESCKDCFPEEARAIGEYARMSRDVCRRSSGMRIENLGNFGAFLDEDYRSLSDVLGELTDNMQLKTVLGSLCLCYGAAPSEVGFANHCRVSLGLQESLTRIADSGADLIRALERRLEECGVEISCGTWIEELDDFSSSKARAFILNTGEKVTAENCILTIHPSKIMELLPSQLLSKAFTRRVASFEPSIGFFTIYGHLAVDDNCLPGDSEVEMICPDDNIDRHFHDRSARRRPLFLLNHKVKGHQIINASELSFPEDVDVWRDSRSGCRPREYEEYKAAKTEEIKQRVLDVHPDCRSNLELADSASLLTYRDYMHTPHGAAYGIKHKIGQYSLLGRLPVRNLYAAGQSAGLPGILGVVMTSAMVVRKILGPERFTNSVEERL